jgi:sugar diacid utilization regulator
MPLDQRFLPIADKFLEFVRAKTGYNTIVCDETGTIARAIVRSRIGNVHAGAQRIMRNEVDLAEVTAEEEAANPLTKEGVNYPIVVDGRRVGTFGIAGPLDSVRPLAQFAVVVLGSWLREMKHQNALHDATSKVFTGVDELAKVLERSSQTAQQIAQVTSSAAAEAVEKLQQAEAVVATVQRIALQSRILSLNGSVEATRAGDQGRAFAVVAKDMTRLAEETKATSAAIQKTLTEIAKAVGHFQEAVNRSTAAATDERSTFLEVTKTITDLKQVMNGLTNTFGDDSG